MSIDFDELIHRQVESDTLDYKAHQSWNAMSSTARGKFVRHLAAFANTGGGFLVVGVGEDASGCPCDYTGLTEEESRSFDPSAVGAYVNRGVDPPIDFSLERPTVRGKRYAVFVVRPVRDLPHVCTRSVENELQTGVFYIRTRDASSRPAHRALEMHRLIQRALRNQRELLAKMLRGILYETRNASESPEEAKRAEREAADDVFSSSRNYFRRRRSPRPGEPGVLLEYSVSLPEISEFPIEQLREAAILASGDGKFISAEEIRRANPVNVALRYLSPSSPRMIQLFRRGWIQRLEYLEAREAEISASDTAEKLAAFCLFVSDYYRELGLEETLLEVVVEASGIADTVLRSGGVEYPACAGQIRCAISRSAQDIGRDIRGYSARLLRSFGEGFGLPDSVLEDEDRRGTLRVKESSR